MFLACVNAINHGMSEAVNKKTYSKHQKKHQVLKKSDLLVAVLKHMKGIKIKKSSGAPRSSGSLGRLSYV